MDLMRREETEGTEAPTFLGKLLIEPCEDYRCLGVRITATQPKPECDTISIWRMEDGNFLTVLARGIEADCLESARLASAPLWTA